MPGARSCTVVLRKILQSSLSQVCPIFSLELYQIAYIITRQFQALSLWVIIIFWGIPGDKKNTDYWMHLIDVHGYRFVGVNSHIYSTLLSKWHKKIWPTRSKVQFIAWRYLLEGFGISQMKIPKCDKKCKLLFIVKLFTPGLKLF